VDIPYVLTPHTVTFEPYLGAGAYGPRYGPAVTSRAYVEHRRRLVRDPAGARVTSETTVYLPLAAGDVPPQSRFTALAGDARTRTVITTSRFEHPQAPSHLEVMLQ
jgi:hypothetical protein